MNALKLLSGCYYPPYKKKELNLSTNTISEAFKNYEASFVSEAADFDIKEIIDLIEYILSLDNYIEPLV